MGKRENGTWFLICLAALMIGYLAVVGPNGFVLTISGLITILFFAYLIRHVLFAISSSQWIRADLAAEADLTYTPPVTVMVACKNEELVVDTLVDRLFALEYPPDKIQVIVVDDDSDDATGEILDRRAAQDSRLLVIHRPPGSTGGKSGALNTASQVATGEIMIIFDADHEPSPSTILRLVRHFEHPRTAAVMGRCVIKNPADSLMARMVWLEYLAGYLCDEYGRQAMATLPAYGGANCAVRASALEEIGGYNEASVTEDTDLTLRLILAGWKVRYDVTAVDYEQAVPDLQKYRKQRYRWARGHQQVWRDYWPSVLRTKQLRPWQKLETMMFLWLYHVPVASFFSFLLIPLMIIAGGASLPPWVLIMFPLFLLGPFLQIGTGLLLTHDAKPRDVWIMFVLIPVVIAFVFTCTRCWYDGVRGTQYKWAKTARTAT